MAKMNFKNSIIGANRFRKEVWDVLPAAYRRKLAYATIAQGVLSVLDFGAVLLAGIIGSLAVSGVQSSKASGASLKLIELLGISDFTFQKQVATLGLIAGFLLTSKTLISAYLSKRIFLFMSRGAAEISSRLIEKFFSSGLLGVKKRNSQSTLYALTNGVSAVTLGVIGNSINLVSDSFLLLIMFFGLLTFDPLVSLASLVLFVSVGLIMHRVSTAKSQSIANRLVELNIESSASILNGIRLFREIFVSGQLGQYVKEIGDSRLNISRLQGEQSFIPLVGKYAFEITMTLGSLVIATIEFTLKDAGSAISSLAVFLVAGSRISPAVLRVQQTVLQVKNSSSSAQRTMDMIREYVGIEPNYKLVTSLTRMHEGFQGIVDVRNLSFKFEDKPNFVLDDISLKIECGSLVSLVGKSGSGKTTFVDLLLGQIAPSKGSVHISSMNPKECIERFPGAIGYVPQEIFLVEGSIKKNICIGSNFNKVPDAWVWEAIQRAEIFEWVASLPETINTEILEGGANLSGGQKQRIGIARALLTQPQLLILDEATSALDEETERQIAQTLMKLKGHTTVISIAHRRTIVDLSDSVLKLESGKLVNVRKKQI